MLEDKDYLSMTVPINHETWELFRRLMVKLMNNGNKIMSSKNLSTGIKSGIRSIGDNA